MQILSLHIVTQLWGKSYVNLYANYVLESLAADGNLPALKCFPDIIYEIYTTPSDKLALEANSNFNRIMTQLKQWMVVRFVMIEDQVEDSYTLMSSCHRQAIAVAESRDAVLIFLQPDVVVGNNSLKTVRDKILAGKRLIMAPGLRTIREEMQKELASYTGASGHRDFIPTRDLVALGVKNLHPISQTLFWEKGRVGAYCSHLYWQVGDISIYTRCAHMHPLMVYTKNKNCDFDHTIDWDYFDRACPQYDDWFVPKSSDEICLLELSGFTKFQGTENWKTAKIQTLVRFLDTATRPSHLKLFSWPYLFKGTELKKSAWIEQHNEANDIISAAIQIHKTRSLYRKACRKIEACCTTIHAYLLKKKMAIAKSDNIILRLFFNTFYWILQFLWRIKNPERLKEYFSRIKIITLYLSNLILGLTLDIISYPFSFMQKLMVKQSRQIKALVIKIKFLIEATNNNFIKFVFFILYYPLRFLWRLLNRIGFMMLQSRDYVKNLKSKSDCSNVFYRIFFNTLYYPMQWNWRLLKRFYHFKNKAKVHWLKVRYLEKRSDVVNKSILGGFSIIKLKTRFLELKTTADNSNYFSLKLSYTIIYYLFRVIWRFKKNFIKDKV